MAAAGTRDAHLDLQRHDSRPARTSSVGVWRSTASAPRPLPRRTGPWAIHGHRRRRAAPG
ncbi:hypothetical protein QJS66_05715 [Kocuria rhizophila]|nr:hypothetical protein QJS66_05715 [Kocuria rhizophila]